MDQPGSHTLSRGNQPAADRMRELLARTVQDQFTDQRVPGADRDPAGTGPQGRHQGGGQGKR